MDVENFIERTSGRGEAMKDIKLIKDPSTKQSRIGNISVALQNPH